LAVELAVAYVSIAPSLKNFRAPINKELSAAEKSAGASGQAIGKNLGNGFANTFKKIAGPALAVLGAGAIASFTSGAVSSFSELEDSTAAAGVVFGDSMQKIITQSKTASKDLGLTQQQVINAANTFGTYGKAAGLSGDALAAFATEQTALAADMASFKGTSPEQAIEAIGAALRGETEPIRAYGVMLDDASLKNEALAQGLISSTKDALSPQNKTLAAQALILKQTADAQGDFARTSDSTANVAKTLSAETEDLSAKFGSVLAPAFTAAKTAAIGAVSGVSGILDKVIAFQGALSAGAMTPDLVRAIGLDPSQGFGAVVGEGIGSIRAFGAAWSANDGDITSSGFPGFMEMAAFKLRGFLESAKEAAGTFGAALGPALKEMGPPALALLMAISPLGIVLKALAPVLPELATVAGQLASVIADGLVVAVEVLTPILAGIVGGIADFSSGLTSSEGGVSGLTSVIVAAGGAFLAYKVGVIATTVATNAQAFATKAAAAGQWLMNAAMTANPIGIVVVAIAGLVAGLVYFFTQTELGRTIIENVWGAIKSFIGGVVKWFQTYVLPVVSAIFKGVGAVFSWLYNNVVKPVFDGIKWYIGVWWTVVSGIFQVVVALVRNVLGPIFEWFYNKVIKPVFDLVSLAVRVFWNSYVKPIFDAVVGFLRNTLGPAFEFWKGVVTSVFNVVRDKISGVWNSNIKPVFDALKKGVEALPAAFEAATGGIGRAWDAIKAKIKEPIRAGIGFINEGLIGKFNTIPGVNIKKLDLPPGFQRGGYTGDGAASEFAGHVHKGEYVFTKAQTAALGKDRLAQMASAAVRGDKHALGAPMRGSEPHIYGGPQMAAQRAREMKFHGLGSFPMSMVNRATAAWNGLSGVSARALQGVRDGFGSNSVGVRYGGMANPNWIGYYTGQEVSIKQGGPNPLATLVHEIGHALGLNHNTGNTSVMHPMLMGGGGAVWPTSYDAANLRSIYGAPGSGVARDPGNGGGAAPVPDNPLDGVVDWFTDKLKKAFPGGGMFIDAAGGLAKAGIEQVTKMVTDIKNGIGKIAGDVFGKVKDFFGGAGQLAPTLYDNGGVLSPNGGRPQLVQNKTGKPEYIFTNREMQALTSGGGSGVTNNYYGPVGFDPEELAQKQETTRRRAQTMAGMDGVVFA
jgi:hypothetical protein